jgi:hemerythrin
MSLVWREQLSVGNDAIDSDHRYLIDIVNRVEQGMITKNHKSLMAALDSLSRYSQEHFAREEKIAKAAGYQQVPDLNQSHEALSRQLEEVKTEIGQMQEWSPEVVDRFTRLLRSWLIDHVVKEDLLMKPTLQKLSPRFNPI